VVFVNLIDQEVPLLFNEKFAPFAKFCIAVTVGPTGYVEASDILNDVSVELATKYIWPTFLAPAEVDRDTVRRAPWKSVTL